MSSGTSSSSSTAKKARAQSLPFIETTPATVRSRCPLSTRALDDMLAARAELTLDGARPDRSALRRRLAGFWLADETVLYLGLAGTSVRARVRQYYKTPLGARRPHAGGWF